MSSATTTGDETTIGDVRRGGKKRVREDDESDANADAKADAKADARAEAEAEARAESAALTQSLVVSDRFCFVTQQAAPLAILATCLSELVSSLRIVLSVDGISATGIDDAKTVVARWTMRSAEMIEGIFRPPACDGNVQEIMVDARSLRGYLDACSKASVMRLTLDDDACPNRMLFHTVEGKRRGAFMMQLNAMDPPNQLNEMAYRNQVTMRDFWDVLRSVKPEKKFVDFALNERDFDVTMYNTTGELKFSWELNSDVEPGAKKSDTVDTEFIMSPVRVQLKTLMAIARLSKASTFVSISLPEYYPRMDTNGKLVPDKEVVNGCAPPTTPLCITVPMTVGCACFLIAPYSDAADDV